MPAEKAGARIPQADDEDRDEQAWSRRSHRTHRAIAHPRHNRDGRPAAAQAGLALTNIGCTEMICRS